MEMQFSRPSGIYITKDDTIYVADSESGPDTGARERPGWTKGIRIGSAKDGKVFAFIQDMEPDTPDHSGAEGLGVDDEGNVYGAVVRRKMLEKQHPELSRCGYSEPFLLSSPRSRFGLRMRRFPAPALAGGTLRGISNFAG